MANDMNRRGFLKYAAASALGMGALGVMTGCSSKETASSSAASTSGAVYTPGTYTASAEGYGSDVTVTVTFDETSITNVVVDSSGETENVGAAAAEKLADQVLSAQSSAIDGVTGATKTSKAVKYQVEVPAAKVTPELAKYVDKEVTLGIRPEALHDDEMFLSNASTGVVDATVEITEMMGAETYLYLVCAGVSLTARVDPRSTARPQDEIKIALDPNKIHLFDKETEETIIN